MSTEPLVRVPDVAKHLSVSKSWINKAVLGGTMPVHRVGRNLRFRLTEIDQWIDKGAGADGDEVT